ncbi:MAG TPA: UDP-glucose/GDP-mannose dehydrogenase family protein [Phycisphaerales bacterium]|nr:UDP-glucose/GDP-mannose dehydrogenase family protein [Phycisphaerales bacterium]
MRLSMVGTGYVGLVTGVCLSNTGNHVTCLDVDARKIEMLKRGQCPIYEPGLTELMDRNIAAGRLHFTTDAGLAHRDADMIFICVGTPSDERGHTDLSYILKAADDVGDLLRSLGPGQKPKVVVVKSTVPVGTTLAVKQRIRERAGPGIPFGVANNPEFLKEGAAIEDFNKSDRVVVGVDQPEVGQKMRDLYDPFVRNGHPIFVMDILSSEMVKYASNNFLATKISFINEMANLCEAYGADINRVREGMCSDKRIGHQFLYPGLGYGGSCFPKDTLACIMMGDKAGMPARLSQAVHEVNQRQRERFFDKIMAHFGGKHSGGLGGRTLAFWGIAFKPRTDDIREAPALTLIRKAVGYGAKVRAFDPVANENARQELGSVVEVVDDMYQAVRGADALVISTDWDEFKSPDFAKMAELMNRKLVFDGRNLYRPQQMADLGFAYVSVGRAPGGAGAEPAAAPSPAPAPAKAPGHGPAPAKARAAV